MAKEIERFLRIVDQDLLKEEEGKKNRKRSGKFSPSSFGRCYRLQVLNRLDYPKSEKTGLGTLRIFKLGNILHEYLQEYFPKQWCEVRIEEDDVLGFADVVTSYEVADFKTYGKFAEKWLPEEGDHKLLQEKKLPAILQVVYYAMMLKKEWARIVFVSRDDMFHRDFPLEVENWRGRVEEELVMLRKYWNDKVLPAPIPRTYNGQDCKYCAWKTTCKNGEIVEPFGRNNESGSEEEKTS